jgi:hypothetical protein
MKDKDLRTTGLAGKVLVGVIGNAVEGRWDDARRTAATVGGTTTAQRVEAVTDHYVRQLAVLGAAAGGTAAVPGVGTIAALGAATAEVAAFAHRAAELILAIGAVHGHTGSDAQERKSWVLAVLTFGESAAAELGAVSTALASEAARTASSDRGSWFQRLNGYLGRKLLARFGARRGAAMLGRVLPFGIGAAFGAGTNYVLAKRLAQHADRFFAALSRDAEPTADLEVTSAPLAVAAGR